MITSIQYHYVYSLECFNTFRRMFYDMPQHFFQYCLVSWRIFPRMFSDILRNVWQHSSEYLRTFLGMFGDIPWNVWWHSPKCLRTFPWRKHSPHSPRSPRSVPRSYVPGLIHSPFFSVVRVKWKHAVLCNNWYCTYSEILLTVARLSIT